MNIKEVAKRAGVSVATVSRTLNRPELVLESTRKRILDTIEEMDYVPNPSAMSLSTGRTGTIACVVPTLRNEFFNQLVEGCQRILAYSGYKLLIYSAANSGVFLERLDQRSIDGIILSGSNYTRENRANLDILQVPCVLIENAEQFADFRELPPTVYIEDYDGVQFALKYLYAEGNRCFGILAGDQDYIVTQRRLRAVREFFSWVPDCQYYVEHAGYSDLGEAQAAGLSFLSRNPRPTAIFTFNDMLAAGVLRSLLRSGVDVPGQMELMGFDDIPLASYFTPSLSTMSAPNRRLGEKAAEMLLARIAGKTIVQNVLYPLDIRLRETTKNTVAPDKVPDV